MKHLKEEYPKKETLYGIRIYPLYFVRKIGKNSELKHLSSFTTNQKSLAK